MIGYQPAIHAARTPDAIAVSYGARGVSYAELRDRAFRVANALLAQGIGTADRVAVLLHNCPAFLELMFGTALIGAIFVPVNFRLVAREVGALFDASTPSVLFAGNGFREVLASLAGRESLPPNIHWIDDEPPETDAAPLDAYETWIGRYPSTDPRVVVAPDAVQMLLHSSGTTGLPKGIAFTHRTTFASCASKIIDFSLDARDVTVVFGPLFHAGPLLDLALPLMLRGGRIFLGQSRRFDPLRLLTAVAEERGTVIPIYPTMLRRVIALAPTPHLDLTCLRLILTGGEAAPDAVIRGVLERFPHAGFVNNYGSTEGGPITTFLPPHEALRKIGSVGRASFGIEVRLGDADDQPVPPHAVGEILVRGPFVTPGYWNRPDLTAEATRNGWWHTGDLAWRDDEGFIYISGRSKDMIKSGTENIYPVEVENVIASLEGVVETGVIGVPDEEWGESVAAFIVAAPDARLDVQRVIAHCREHLASYKKPKYVLFVDALPRGTTNKIDKRALRVQFASQQR